MGLRNQITEDIQNILEDSTTGFGWDIRLTDPDQNFEDLIGFSNDISSVIDPDTGVVVSGRSATVAIHLNSIKTLSIPKGIVDSSLKPWLVKFNDIVMNI